MGKTQSLCLALTLSRPEWAEVVSHLVSFPPAAIREKRYHLTCHVCSLRPGRWSAGGGCKSLLGVSTYHCLPQNFSLSLLSVYWVQEAECFLLWAHFMYNFPAFLDTLLKCRDSLVTGERLLSLNYSTQHTGMVFPVWGAGPWALRTNPGFFLVLGAGEGKPLQQA